MRIVVILSLIIASGCSGSDSDPKMSVSEIRHWAMPPDGSTIPAPRGVTVDTKGLVFVLDDAGRVLVFTSDGELDRMWRMPDSEVGNPEGICVLQDGRIAVADTHYHQLVIFEADGNVDEIRGQEGEGQGEFIWPVAVVQDDEGHIYVSEYGGNHRIQKFTLAGKFLTQFGGFGTAPGQFQRPSGIVWSNGKIYAADAFNNRIQVFSDEGEFLGMLGVSPEWGVEYPYDLTHGNDGTLYVVEYATGRVSWIDTEGNLRGRLGAIGSGTGEFQTPWGIASNRESGRLYVADTGNRRMVEIKL